MLAPRFVQTRELSVHEAVATGGTVWQRQPGGFVWRCLFSLLCPFVLLGRDGGEAVIGSST